MNGTVDSNGRRMQSAHQPALFSELDARSNRHGLRDPAVAENKNRPIHRWIPWIAGYSAHFVDDVIDAFSGPAIKGEHSPLVLDPFAGVGTTMVQAMFHGCRSVGFEINQYAALAARVKVNSRLIDLMELDLTMRQLKDVSRKWDSDTFQPVSRPPRNS